MKINRSPSTYLKASAMSSIIFLICVLIPFVRANCDETPAIVDSKYGENTYCHFSYFDGVDSDSMKDISKLAKVFGPAQAKGYRIAFAELSGTRAAATLVDDSNEFACGMAYLLPVCEFQKILKRTFDSNNQKVQKMITVSVDVTKDGQQISMKCNTFQTMKPPDGDKVICKCVLDLGVKAYTESHLSEDCIAKLREIPNQECVCT